MNTIARIFRCAAIVGFSAAAGLAHSATVYCPNGPTGALVPPTSGRYVQVTNAANPGTCYFQAGNIQVSGVNSDIPAIATAAGVPTASMLLLSLNGSSGLVPSALSSTGSLSGSWSLSGASLWSSYSSLYLGFHFGNGGGNPDSFVVQLQNSALSGAWSFNAIAPNTLNGISNYYLFGVSNGNPPPGRTPEPATLALVGVGLFAAGAARRVKQKR